MMKYRWGGGLYDFIFRICWGPRSLRGQFSTKHRICGPAMHSARQPAGLKIMVSKLVIPILDLDPKHINMY